jgi:hypothetical protein
MYDLLDNNDATSKATGHGFSAWNKVVTVALADVARTDAVSIAARGSTAVRTAHPLPATGVLLPLVAGLHDQITAAALLYQGSNAIHAKGWAMKLPTVICWCLLSSWTAMSRLP